MFMDTGGWVTLLRFQGVARDPNELLDKVGWWRPPEVVGIRDLKRQMKLGGR